MGKGENERRVGELLSLQPFPLFGCSENLCRIKGNKYHFTLFGCLKLSRGIRKELI